MTKEEQLDKIIEIAKSHLNCKFNPDDYCKYDAIHESQIPFMADDILGYFADVIPVSEPIELDCKSFYKKDGSRPLYKHGFEDAMDYINDRIKAQK